jgi:thiamine biosynthesis lipoprotein
MLFLRTYYLKKPIQKDNFLFGTLIRITAYGPGASNAIDRAFTEMSRIESFTAQDRGEISNINLNAGKEPVKIGDELFSLLQVVFKLAEESEGYFNPVIGALVEIWGFGYGGEGRLPLVKEISSILPITKRELVEFNEEEKTIFLLREGMKIDLGGVAKGYALDRAWEILKSSGVKGALINGGESSIRVLGERPGGGPWRIAISHPRKEKWIGILELCSGKAVGTSADTERYIEKDGRRYSHLLNPNTGYSPSDLFSATVIADTALEADLYSTAVFVAEGVERLEYLTNRGLEGVVVYSDLNIKATKGIKKMIIY